MAPYFVLAGFTAFFGWFNQAVLSTVNISRREKAQGKKYRTARWTPFDLILLSVMVTFSAVRWEVGTDFVMYSNQFTRLYTGNWGEQIEASPHEIGYTLLALTIRQFSETPEPLFWVTSILTIVPIYVALKKQSRDMTMSLILFMLLAFFVAPFNIIRQGIAISLNFWAHTFIDKNKTAFFVINAIAATFHVTAIFAAVIQFLIKNRRLTPVWFVIIIGAALVAMTALPSWTGLIDFLAGFNERYEGYVEATAAGIGTYLLIGSRLGLALYGVSLGRSENYKRYALYAVIGVAFLIIGTQSVVISRMEYYFGMFLLLLIPNQLAKRKDKVIHQILIYAASAIFLWQYLANWGQLIPYKTTL